MQKNNSKNSSKSNSKYNANRNKPVSHFTDQLSDDDYSYPYRKKSSSAAGAGRALQRKKRKRRALRWSLASFFVLLVLLASGALIFVNVMLGRLNRPGDTSGDDTPSWGSNQDVINILLMGADENDNGTDGRADTMMLVSIDRAHSTIKLVSFLRDLYLPIPGYGKNRLNAAYVFGGPNLTIQTIETNFSVDIDRYVTVDFEAFTNIIDRMGGIEVEVTKAEADYIRYSSGPRLSEGVNHLNGDLALLYSRIRKLDSDFERTSRQQKVIQSIVNKMKTLNIFEISSIMYDLLPLVTTNLSNSQLIYLASVALQLGNYPITSMSIPSEGAYTSQTINEMSVLVPNLVKNALIVREFLYPPESVSDPGGESGGGMSSSSVR